MAFDVVTIGEAKLDAFLTIESESDSWHFDQEKKQLCFTQGSKVEVDKCDFCVGGDAANVSVGLSRLGLKVSIFAEIGDDEFSFKIRNTFAKEKVDRSNIIQTTGAASSFSMILNTKGDRVIFSEHVVREHNFVFDHLEKPKLLYLTSIGKEWKGAYKNSVEYAQKYNIPLAFNPGTRQLREGRDIVGEILKSTEILFVNKEEAELLTRGPAASVSHSMSSVDSITPSDDGLKSLLTKLQDMGVKNVVVTDGNNGSYCLDEKGGFYKEGVAPGEIVERTGAGDAYASGFLAAYVSGLPIQTAMQWGAKNAAAVVGKVGAQAGLLKREQIES